jgi:hypothetical protein
MARPVMALIGIGFDIDRLGNPRKPMADGATQRRRLTLGRFAMASGRQRFHSDASGGVLLLNMRFGGIIVDQHGRTPTGPILCQHLVS